MRAHAALLVLVLAVSSGTVSAAGRRGEGLVVQAANGRTGEQLWCAPVEPGQIMSLVYRHSVSQSEVSGTFRVTADAHFDPVDTTFSAFGPGLPWTSESEVVRRSNGALVVDHSEESRPELRIWVSPITRDRVTVGDCTVFLTEGLEREMLVVFRVHPSNRRFERACAQSCASSSSDAMIP